MEYHGHSFAMDDHNLDNHDVVSQIHQHILHFRKILTTYIQDKYNAVAMD